MKNIIENNYYGLLGILPDASTKQIIKNTKEINRYLQIDEQPKYPFDFNLYSARTEKQIKTASNEILNPKINIIHFFFRVFLDSETEKNFVMNIEDNLAYDIIMDYYNKFDKNSLNVKKNTAIMLLILLTVKNNIEKRIKEKQEEDCKRDVFVSFDEEQLKDVTSIVETSISLWKTILSDSEQYLNDFIKLYKFYDEIGIADDVYKNLKENLKQELLYIYSDISDTFINGEYILKKYITEFDLQNTNLNLRQIDNIYIEIDKQINILKKMNISENGIFDEQKKKIIDDFFSNVKYELHKLKEFGFYESSKTKILRDTIANTVREHSVDLFNNIQDVNSAMYLLNFCIEVVATENLKIKLLDDRKYLELVKRKEEELQLYESIKDQIAILKTITSDSIRVMPIESKKTLNMCMEKIKQELTKLKKLGMYESSIARQFRDRISIVARNTSVNFYNLQRDVDFSFKLLEFAYAIISNAEVKEKINKDINQLNVLSRNNYFSKIIGNVGCLVTVIVFFLFIVFGGK